MRKAFTIWLSKSIWVFPIILALIFALLTVFRIHGSSIGVYHQLLNGQQESDPNLIFGQPRAIRSDEWKAWTPTTILQAKTGFESFNRSLGSGRELSFKPEAPTLNWVTIFRPHNWSFFIVPLENAFAFRWWLGMYLLAVATYFLVLRFTHQNNKILAIILAISFGLSPFLLWWHQSLLFMSFAFAVFGIIIGMRIINQEKIPWLRTQFRSNLAYMTALGYIGACFGLLIYVPFLVPIAIVSLAFLIGYALDKRLSSKNISSNEIARRLALFVPPILVIILVGLAFFLDNKELINTVGSSEYPGQRRVSSGQLAFSPLLPLLGSFLLPLIQKTSLAVGYYANQSEASNFILILPFLLIPSICLQIYDYRKNGRINYTLTFLTVVAILFITRISLPIGDSFFKLLLLDRVPNNRLLAGIGFVGFLQLIIFINVLSKISFNKHKQQLFSVAYAVLCLSTLLIFSRFVETSYPLFIPRYAYVIGLATLFVSIIGLFLAGKPRLGAAVLLVFTFGSSFMIMPLYKGLGTIENSKIVQAIEQNSEKEDRWVVLDNMNFQSLPMIAGRGSVGGVQVYTDKAFWRQIDKDGSDEIIYNRQAHAIFLSNTLDDATEAKYNVTSIENDLELVKGNVFKVKFSCSKFTYDNIDYALANQHVEAKHKCLKLVDTVTYPEVNFFIYKVVKN